MLMVASLSIRQCHDARLQHQITSDTPVNIASNGRLRFCNAEIAEAQVILSTLKKMTTTILRESVGIALTPSPWQRGLPEL